MSRETGPSYEFGSFRLDPAEQVLLHDGRPVPLTPKVFDVLRVLVEHSGHLVEKDFLLKEVWPDSFVEEGALSRSVSILRKVLDDSPAGRIYIATVPTRGYRFVAPVTACHREAVPAFPPARHIPADMSDSPPQSPPAPAPLRERGRSGLIAGIVGLGALLVGVLTYGTAQRHPPAAAASAPLAVAHRQVTSTGRAGAPTLSPDGTRIAYVSNDVPEKQLMVQELSGGPALPIFSAPEIGYPRWSPDGTELLIWARGAGPDGVYVMSQLGGTPRRIAAGLFIACWSPDGSTIAVASYVVGKIWLRDRLGREMRTLSLDGTHWSIGDLDWSPVSGLLAFVSNDYQGRYSLWTIHPDGSQQRQVVADSSEIASVRWTPDGAALYYSRRLNQTVSIARITLSPSRTAREPVGTTLVTGLESDGRFALSASGTRLVYTRAPHHSNLFVLDTEGGGQRPPAAARALTDGTLLIERPRVSPDGRSVVFNVGHEGAADLFTMPITGGPPKQLTFLEAFSLTGVWSPDGRRIVFASTRGGTPRVWTIDVGGGEPRALSSGDLSDSFDVAWPESSRILYQQAGNRNYYELDPDTGMERLLVRDSSVGWMFSPVYSPDGRKIAVFWNRRPTRGIWIIDVASRYESPVYATTAASAKPLGWSADSRSIYVIEGKNSTSRGPTAPLGETLTEAKILIVPVGGGNAKTVAAIPFDEIGGVSMTSDGRRFVFPVYSSRSDVWVVDNFDASFTPRLARR
jgi:Tol biopolymer transport system component/DNA-binding winged helix-turn-helix (wHTH) protein